ncbi:MAG: AI-2E family transporter [Deltaproteobacteria bacterium]|nr:AI-2E family transporter [Deltaproteobacteria bacterium]
MNTLNQHSNDKTHVARALEASIQIGIVGLVVLWCFKIGRPFLETIVWGIIIALAIHPIYNRLKSALGGRNRLAATLITIFALILLLVPTIMLSYSLIDAVQDFSAQIEDGTLKVPPPSESVRSWPVIGEPVYKWWSLGSQDLGTALNKMAPILKKYAMVLPSTVAHAGAGILIFVVSIIIAGVLLAHGDGAQQAAVTFFRRLAGERGDKLVELAGATVRSVAQGILGVAVIQAVLGGLGCLVAGVPAAGFWALLVLILAIVQLPSLIILGPIIVYVFSTSSTITAILFAIWSILVGISDAFLKPLLIGRGVDIPMLIVFIGAIGGFIASGVIGLFVGAMVFSAGYKLFLIWLKGETEQGHEPGKAE